MRLLKAAQRHGSGRARALHQRCTCCVTAAGLPPAMGPLAQSALTSRLREALPNARDLHEAYPAIPPGRVIRCANPSSATAADAEYLLGELRIRDLIDLRAGEEILEDDPGSELMARAVLLTYRRGWLQPGQLFAYQSDAAPLPAAAAASYFSINLGQQHRSSASRTQPPWASSTRDSAYAYAAGPSGAAAADSPGPECPRDPVPEPLDRATSDTADAEPLATDLSPKPVAVRHNISLLDRGRYYLGLASRIPASVTATALLTNCYSKPAARAMLLPYVNGGGLQMLYEMLLDSSRLEFRQVMEVLLAAAEARHCVMFFCRAGKDRTGLVAAMVLAVAGADEQQIVADYTRSDAYHRVALAGLESREELAGLDRAQFERAPPEVMEATLAYVGRRYGSLTGYLTDIGFGPDRQQRLRELLTSKW